MKPEDFFTVAFITSILRGATPLLFASMAGLISERSGLVQIGLEGMMLVGALAAALTTSFTHTPWLGLVVAGFAGSILALLYGFFVIRLKADQVVTGMAANILALGIAPFITKIAFNTTGSTPSLPVDLRFSFEPFVIVFLTLGALTYLYNKTRAGLYLRFAGENPEALLAAGISVTKLRWWSVFACGQLAGWGGASLSLFLASSYSPNMTAGRGFMALAALIFGGWHPMRTAGACLLFSFADAVQIRLQGSETFVPLQFVQILPYVVTIIALAGFFGQSRPPKALGQEPH